MGKGAGKKGPNGSGTWHRGEGADEWTSGKRDNGAKIGDKKGLQGQQIQLARRQGQGRQWEQRERQWQRRHIGVNCPYKWANSIDEEDDQTSSLESEPEGENAEELASLETPDEDGGWCWPEKSRVTRWRRRIDSRPTLHYSLKTMKVSKLPED